MSMRSDWQKAKDNAKKFNNGVEIKFVPDLKLGDALDKVETTGKAFEKTRSGEHNAAWAKAADAHFAAASAAKKVLVAYFQALPKLKINDVAREKLDAELTVGLMHQIGEISKEAKRIEPLLVKAGKVK